MKGHSSGFDTEATAETFIVLGRGRDQAERAAIRRGILFKFVEEIDDDGPLTGGFVPEEYRAAAEKWFIEDGFVAHPVVLALDPPPR